MPAAYKVRWAQLRVGVMALVAMIILGVLIWLFTSEKPIWERYATLYTYMKDSAALAKGAPVRLNGILIGGVSRVELSGSAQPDRIVRVVMHVQYAMLKEIPVDSIAEISAENVLGTKYINISKGRSSETVKPNGEVRSEPSAEIADLVRKGFGLFDSAQAIINRLDNIVEMVESGKGSVGQFVMNSEFHDRLVATVAEFQKVATAISSGKGTVGRLIYDESLYNNARAAVQHMNELIDDLQQGQGTAGRLLKDPALYNDARASVAQFQKLLDDLNAGKGTAGKLLKDEAAYDQIRSILGRLDTTMERVNAGQGTLGQLVVNPQLYESMNGLTQELQSLVKDIHKNPKKFLRIKLGLF
jgi:phospholipid/cholesterol/gamma-HCH transport system substrate-binding protein